jgi:gamma-glutamylcyclotransferase (GGCT)/AIG2-like uncharacterized protein YtfP
MGNNIFVYGSLMNEEVFKIVTGFSPVFLRATLFDYKRVKLKNRVYPAIVKNCNSCVEGFVLCDLPNEVIAVLDCFEDSIYTKSEISVSTSIDDTIKADAYIVFPKNKKHIINESWDYENFKNYKLDTYLISCDRFRKKRT